MSKIVISPAVSIVIFQKKNGLTPDGLIGPGTFEKMARLWQISFVQLAHFLAQCHHESGCFKRLVENLNYSAQQLANTWPNRYAVNSKAKVKIPNKLALRLANNPQAIANNVYANRMGNGPETNGDGWKHKGHGFLMTTGKENQYAFSDYVKDPAVKTNPALIAEKYPLESALFFFAQKKVWCAASVMSNDAIKNVSVLVNGGLIGLDERIELTHFYYEISQKIKK